MSGADALAVLGHELERAGWSVRLLPGPVLRVFSPAVPILGETVTLEEGAVPGRWWYRSSTGRLLGADAVTAAARVGDLLGPLVAGALARRSPEREMSVAELRRRFPGVPCWWGAHTRQWWALTAAPPRLVCAATVDGLARALADVRPTAAKDA
ncbi:hypothetical protein [Actinomadura kijaniata]|uniref:hypothetical protein n=1 Tax=Actinomadura kijaniata TaxID=46161 RepID=UPI0008321315|nr:hypothetical protein [Actinomadura kijaniata]